MVQDRPLLLVGLAVSAGFALVLFAGAVATMFMVTGGFGGGPERRADGYAPQYAAVTRLDATPSARGAVVRITDDGFDAMLVEADYAPDPALWIDDLEGAPAQSNDETYAFGADGRLYQEIRNLYSGAERGEAGKKAFSAEARKVSVYGNASPS